MVTISGGITDNRRFVDSRRPLWAILPLLPPRRCQRLRTPRPFLRLASATIRPNSWACCSASKSVLAKDKAAREALGDPRPSLAERYNSRDDYLNQVRLAAENLAKQHYILERDIGLCLKIAAARYDACMAQS